MIINRAIVTGLAMLATVSAFAQSLVVSPSAPRVGQLATITQTFASAPGGSVSFFANGLAIPSCQNVVPSGNAATCTTKFDDTMSLNLTTIPAGGQLVGFVPRKASATITLTVPPTVVSGQSVNLSATIAGLDGVPSPTGTVSFRDGTTDLGINIPVASGVAGLSTAAIQSGNRVIWAAYSGDSRYDSGFAVGTTTVSQDTTPNNFSFAPQNGVAAGVQLQASTTIDGFSTAVSVSVQNGEYSIGCTGSYSSAPGTLNPPSQQVCVRHTSSCAANGSVTTTLTAGGVAGTFTSTTGAEGCGTANDGDGDGIPDSVEATNTPATSATVKDNNVFVASAASNRLFAQQIYRSFYGREATAPEADALQATLDQGQAAKIDVLVSSYTGAQYLPQVLAVVRLYLGALDRLPDTNGYRFWVWGSGFPSFQAMADFFASSPEFVARYGQLTNEQFVQQLYRNILRREADPSGLTFWSAQLNAGSSRGAVLLGLTQSAEFQQASSATIRAVALYTAFFDRLPTPAEIDALAPQVNAGASDAQLAIEFYNSAAFGSRLVQTPPARCESSFSFSAASATVNPATAGGRFTLTVNRGGNTSQACTVDVFVCTVASCGTTAVANTHYATNDASTPFAGSPPRYTVSFAAGDAAAKQVNVAVPAAAATASVADVVFGLRNNAWGSTLGTSTIKVTIQGSGGGGGGGGCDSFDGGGCIPAAGTVVNPGGDSTSKCYSSGPGPCASYPISGTGRVSSNTPTGVRTFQYNWNMPSQTGSDPNLDYGQVKQFFLPANQAISFMVLTPAAGVIPAPNEAANVFRAMSWNNYGGGEAVKFVSISKTPGDFDLTKFNAGDPCYGSSAASSLSWHITSGSVPFFVCKLDPNSKYYVNVRFEDARKSINTGQRTDSCASQGTCGLVVNLGAGIQ